MEKVVLSAYRAQLSIMERQYKKITKQKKQNPLEKCRENQKGLLKEIALISEQNLHLYEDYKSGKLDAESFLEQKNRMFSKKRKLEEELAELQKQEETLLNQREIDNDQISRMQDALSTKRLPDEELIKEMYRLIDKVIVYSNQEIKIVWKINDFFQTTDKE